MKLICNLRLFFVFAFTAAAGLLAAYNPPIGGEQRHTFYSPALLGGQASVTGGPFGSAMPGQLSVNPALAGGEQRPILDLSYAMLAGFKQERGFGHIANAGFLYPANWGVISVHGSFLHSRFASLPLGTLGEFRFAYSKDITEKLYVGAGSYFSFGKNWGLGADLGVLYKFGDLGFLKDSKLGVSLTGMGKPYNPRSAGVWGGKSSGYPAIFTPHVGFAASFVSTNSFKMGMHTDLAFPSFYNLTFDTGLHMEIMDTVMLRTGWNFNLAETINKKQTYLPSISAGFRINIDSGKKGSLNKKLQQYEIAPEFAVKPFYNNIWAFGGGVSTHFGTKDTEPPKIEITAENKAYFSPNNDGNKDAMELPFKISDKRYITSWVCEIKNDKGETVRQISNKIPIRELSSAKAFFSLLAAHKGSVAVPGTLRWDGTLDSGEIAADGTYTFTVTASDDNKNISTTEPFTVVVDKTPPEINLRESGSTAAKIFSPDGDGSKDSFTISQSGSKEDLWRGTVYNAENKAVKSFELKNSALENFVWDGKDDSGAVLPDGVYSYSVEAQDRAGNASKKSLGNIIIDTNKPEVNIAIDLKAFSPNGDKVKDEINLDPSVPVTNGLTAWRVEIKNSGGKTVKTFSNGKEALKKVSSIKYGGIDENGKILPEGFYEAVLSAEYENGFTAQAKTSRFELDITKPQASVSAGESIFSPDGDGKIDTVKFSNKASSGDFWHAEVHKGGAQNTVQEKALYSLDFGTKVPSYFEWDGRGGGGTLLPDGKYSYVLRGHDEAGNTAISNIAEVELNTEKADIILQANYQSFSPNGDGSKDSIDFLPVVKSKTKITSYKVFIAGAKGTVVKEFSGSGNPPAKLNWNGRFGAASGAAEVCPDGIYTASFEVELENRQSAKSVISGIEIDTKYPEIEISAPYLIFSPGTGANRDFIPIKQVSSKEEIWTGKILSKNAREVRKSVWNGKAENFDWYADDNLGNKIPDGVYEYVVSSEDKAGNKTEKRIKDIVVDSRVPKVYMTPALQAFSPNADGVKDMQTFSVHANINDGIESWNFYIKSAENGKPVYEELSSDGGKLPASFNWNGKAKDGKIAEGNFIAELSVKYKKGDEVKAETAQFLSSVTAPVLSAALKPKYFSPDNDGIDDDLFIGLKAVSKAPITSWSFEIREPDSDGSGGKLFWKTGGKDKIAEEIIWDGRSLKGETVQSATDYPYTFVVTNEVGLTSALRGYVPVDILVIRDGDKLKIAVPSIIFRPNADDFNGLEDDVVSKNNYVLKRVAEILNKFTEYQVQVEGHANTTTGSKSEEVNALLPLSNLRALAVKNILIKNGVRASRLSSIGMGSSKPVASINDRDNWWKNRRVEFILIKK